MMNTAPQWPIKYDVLGTEVSATTYDELVRLFIVAGRRRQGGMANFVGVHGVSMAALQPDFRYRLNAFDVVAPDGQPIRWALGKLHKINLPDRCYGPELTDRLCKKAADEGVSIYFYGSTNEVLAAMKKTFEDRYPAIRIVGLESPPFRKLSQEENDEVCQRINDSGAGLLFIGLGCPRQDIFAHENRNKIKAVQLCVGAAFDFHAGTKKTAPRWMQDRGLEWLFRFTQEPGRLWKRYLVSNSTFIFLMTRRLVFGR